MKITIKKEDFIGNNYTDCYGCALWRAVMRKFKFKPQLKIGIGGWEVNQNNPRALLFTFNQLDADKIVDGYDSRNKNVIIDLIPTEFFKKNYGLPKTNT